MELMTVRDLVSNIVDTWVTNYPEPQTFHDGSTSGAILAKLKALDLQTCEPEAIEAIIGNKSWTSLRCNLCYKEVQSLALLEEQDNHVTHVCKSCLVDALDLFGDSEAKSDVPTEVPAPAQTRPNQARTASKPLAGRKRSSASQT